MASGVSSSLSPRVLEAWARSAAQGRVQRATISQFQQAGPRHLLRTHWAQWQTALLRVRLEPPSRAREASTAHPRPRSDLRHWPSLASRGCLLVVIDAAAPWQQVKQGAGGAGGPKMTWGPQNQPVSAHGWMPLQGPGGLVDTTPTLFSGQPPGSGRQPTSVYQQTAPKHLPSASPAQVRHKDKCWGHSRLGTQAAKLITCHGAVWDPDRYMGTVANFCKILLLFVGKIKHACYRKIRKYKRNLSFITLFSKK